jgi:hypothetical protein
VVFDDKVLVVVEDIDFCSWLGIVGVWFCPGHNVHGGMLPMRGDGRIGDSV